MTDTAAPTQVNPAVPPQTDSAAPDTSQTPPAAPVAPATPAPQPAPANATAPPSALPKRGLMASVLTGALRGAESAVKATGKRFSNLAQNSPYGQELQTNALAREQAQQQIQAEKFKESQLEKETKIPQNQGLTTDQYTRMLQANTISMDNLHKAAENHQIESLYPMKTAEEKEALIGQIRAQNDADRKFFTDMAESVGSSFFDKGHFAPGNPFNNLTPDHATNIAHGKQVALSNGETGDNADLGFASIVGLENTILDADQNVVVDWDFKDPKNPQPIMQTLKAGQNTWWDASIAHDMAMEKFNQKQGMYQEQIKAKSQAATAAAQEAEAAEHRSAANLNDAYVRELGGGIGGPNNQPLPAIQQAISALPPQVQQGLQQWSPQIQGLLLRGAYGFVDPNTFPQRLTKGGIGITRANATAAMLEINPNYSDDLYNVVKKTQTDFITGKEGQSIRSFNQFLVHADELKRVSDSFQRTNSPILNIPLNKLSAQYMGQPGVPEMMTAIEAARQEWTTFINSGYSPDQDMNKRAAILMNDTSSAGQIMGVLGVMGTQAVGRLDQLNESYHTAIGQDYPNLVTPSGAAAARNLNIDVSRYQSGGSYAGGFAQPVAGKIPPGAVTAGNGTAYTTDGGKTWITTATGKPYQGK